MSRSQSELRALHRHLEDDHQRGLGGDDTDRNVVPDEPRVGRRVTLPAVDNMPLFARDHDQ